MKIVFIGVAAVFTALLLKSAKSEYSIYISLAAVIIIFGYSTGSIELFIVFIDKIRRYANIPSEYISILLKVAGITYISELAASICSDAGFNAIAGQIEFAGRLSIMAVGMPIIFSLIDMLETLLNI